MKFSLCIQNTISTYAISSSRGGFGNATMRMGRNVIDDLHNASHDAVLQIYVRDDFKNEFVGEATYLGGPNLHATGG